MNDPAIDIATAHPTTASRATRSQAASAHSSARARRSELRSRKQRLDAGRALRKTLPRSSHAAWKPPTKEARRSVLEAYAGKSVYQNQGERVVVGQRLMQSSSDIFLGWAQGPHLHDFFGRQLRDMKFSFPVEGMRPLHAKRYAEICGLTLARAHAKSGDPALISGYLGKSDSFDEAIGKFALAYADQNERDYTALVAAVRAGRIKALVEENL